MVPRRTDKPPLNKRYAFIALAVLVVISILTTIPDIVHKKQSEKEAAQTAAFIKERREQEKVVSENDKQIVEWYTSTHQELVDTVDRLELVDKSVSNGDQGALYEHRQLTAKLRQITEESSQFEYEPENLDFEYFIEIYKKALTNFKSVGINGSEIYSSDNAEYVKYVQTSWKDGNDYLERAEELWDEVFVPKLNEEEKRESE